MYFLLIIFLFLYFLFLFKYFLLFFSLFFSKKSYINSTKYLENKYETITKFIIKIFFIANHNLGCFSHILNGFIAYFIIILLEINIL